LLIDLTGFVLKKDQKKESKDDEISLEDLIEREVMQYQMCFNFTSI
jgi:hypothetical protein